MRNMEFKDGFVINGTFPDSDVLNLIQKKIMKFPLIIADPPYGNIIDADFDKTSLTDVDFCEQMFSWSRIIEQLCEPGGAFYVWGGIGKVRFRPFFLYLTGIELETKFQIANYITWMKKRAIGTPHNFLFIREELLYMVLGDIKSPKTFNIPFLKEKRQCQGFDKNHLPKSTYLRCGNVWPDITELFANKLHVNQKPIECMLRIIETSSNEGDWVLDPFAGSGTTAVAARLLNRKFILIEQHPIAFEVICERLQ